MLAAFIPAMIMGCLLNSSVVLGVAQDKRVAELKQTQEILKGAMQSAQMQCDTGLRHSELLVISMGTKIETLTADLDNAKLQYASLQRVNNKLTQEVDARAQKIKQVAYEKSQVERRLATAIIPESTYKAYFKRLFTWK
jgi:chromosome segregation ATPase